MRIMTDIFQKMVFERGANSDIQSIGFRIEEISHLWSGGDVSCALYSATVKRNAGRCMNITHRSSSTTCVLYLAREVDVHSHATAERVVKGLKDREKYTPQLPK